MKAHEDLVEEGTHATAHPAGMLYVALERFIDVDAERFTRRAFVSLSVTVFSTMGAVALTLLSRLAVVDVCSDEVQGRCLAHPSPFYVPVNVFTVFAVVATLVAVVSLLRALALCSYSIHSRRHRTMTSALPL